MGAHRGGDRERQLVPAAWHRSAGRCALGDGRAAALAIDTTLLTAALMLVTILPGAMFGNGWLAMKLCLVVVYVVLGTFALKRGRTPRTRLLCFVAALAVYVFIASVAIEHHPLGMLRPLLG